MTDTEFAARWVAATEKLFAGNLQSLSELGSLALVPAVETLGILAGFYFVAKYLSKIVSGPICKRIDQTLGRFVEKLIYRGLITCSFIFVLHHFGIRSTSFAAVLAAMGFAIGLALQGTLSNFASGILLMVFRPFKVGDLVVAGGVTARVHEIDLFTTSVDTPDNRRLIIPNSSISGHTIENTTFHPHRRVEVPVGVAYSADMDATRQALSLAIADIAGSIVQNEERKSQVLLVGFGSSAVDWLVRVWAPTTDFHSVRDQLVYRMKLQLDDANISIAFPQLDIHFDSNTATHGLLSQRTFPRRSSAPFEEAA